MDNSFIIVLIQLIILLALTFIATYARRKANNYADKKDLKELTTIVEKEKTKYATDLSVIKSMLDLSVINKKGYREREVEAIVEFFSICHWLIYDFLNLSLLWFNTNHYETIKAKSSEFFDNIKKMALAKGKFDLFVMDNTLRKAAHDLHINCISYSSKVEQFVLEIKFALERQIELRDEFIKKFEENRNNIEWQNKIVKAEKEINAKISLFPNQYAKLRQEEHDENLVKLFAQFESSTRFYLAQI